MLQEEGRIRHILEKELAKKALGLQRELNLETIQHIGWYLSLATLILAGVALEKLLLHSAPVKLYKNYEFN